MKNFIKVVGLVCITTVVVLSSHTNTSLPYKITGEFVYIEAVVEEKPTEVEAIALEVLPREPVDLSDAVLTISYEVTNKEGEAETVTLYEGPYKEDFENVGEVTEPNEVEIVLQLSDASEPTTINSVIGTGRNIRFAYIDHPRKEDQFILVGTYSHVLNAENRFSVAGDLNFLDGDLTNDTSAYVVATTFNTVGERQSTWWGPVLVEDKSFYIEGDVSTPLLGHLYVDGEDHYFRTAVIIEPQGEIVVSELGNGLDLLATKSGTGYHAKIIDSWQQNKRYVSLLETYQREYERYVRSMESGDSVDVASDEESVDAKQADDPDTESSTTDKEDGKLVEQLAPAEGCEEAAGELAHSNSNSSIPTDAPAWVYSQVEATNLKNSILMDIAQSDHDPLAQYFAIMLRPYDQYVLDDVMQALAVWQSLEEKFDEVFVANRITPRVDFLETISIKVKNDAALVPGQRIPEFTLANPEGENVDIYTLLGKKDLVLIDFWASWCGPCIAEFPELKKLHAAYTDEDFEIVGISIDSTEEEWRAGLEEHQLPWTNLGELQSWDGPVATSFGVSFIPKTYLVDSHGCIYRNDIITEELKSFLVERYGEDESLADPDVESEDVPDVSG